MRSIGARLAEVFSDSARKAGFRRVFASGDHSNGRDHFTGGSHFTGKDHFTDRVRSVNYATRFGALKTATDEDLPSQIAGLQILRGAN